MKSGLRKLVPAGLSGRRGRKRFVHVLATRIGIGVYDEAWFDFRLSLFEAITVPSIRAQTCQDFTWLLVVDERMPPIARQRLDRAVAGMPNVVIAPVEFKSNLKQALVSEARRRAAERGVSLVMTSRLDDDDAMRVDAMERLHQEAARFTEVSRKQYAVFSFNLGCMWLPSKRLGYTRYHPSHSLTLSLVEPVDRCQGIYSRQHVEIKQQIAPRGAYFASIEGDIRWWLYATHSLADSDTGDQARAQKIINHRYGYRLDDDFLRSFGLHPEVIDDLARLAEPTARRPVLRMWGGAMDFEREIKELRSRLAAADESQREALTARLAEVEAQRHAAGSGFVDDRSTGGGLPEENRS